MKHYSTNETIFILAHKITHILVAFLIIYKSNTVLKHKKTLFQSYATFMVSNLFNAVIVTEGQKHFKYLHSQNQLKKL